MRVLFYGVGECHTLSRRCLEHTFLTPIQKLHFHSSLSQKILILFANITVLKTDATFYYKIPFCIFIMFIQKPKVESFINKGSIAQTVKWRTFQLNHNSEVNTLRTYNQRCFLLLILNQLKLQGNSFKALIAKIFKQKVIKMKNNFLENALYSF